MERDTKLNGESLVEYRGSSSLLGDIDPRGNCVSLVACTSQEFFTNELMHGLPDWTETCCSETHGKLEGCAAQPSCHHRTTLLLNDLRLLPPEAEELLIETQGIFRISCAPSRRHIATEGIQRKPMPRFVAHSVFGVLPQTKEPE